jgi:hypothetical protein
MTGVSAGGPPSSPVPARSCAGCRPFYFKLERLGRSIRSSPEGASDSRARPGLGPGALRFKECQPLRQGSSERPSRTDFATSASVRMLERARSRARASPRESTAPLPPPQARESRRRGRVSGDSRRFLEARGPFVGDEHRQAKRPDRRAATRLAPDAILGPLNPRAAPRSQPAPPICPEGTRYPFRRPRARSRGFLSPAGSRPRS